MTQTPLLERPAAGRSPRGPAAFLWRLALLGAAAAAALVSVPPAVVEAWYAGGVFARLQPIVVTLSSRVPIGLLDVSIVLAAGWVGWRVAAGWREARLSRPRAAAWLAGDLLAGVAGVYLAFLLLWGLNYQRQPATERFGVVAEHVTPERLRALGNRAVIALNTLHEPDRDFERLAFDAVADDLRPAFGRALERLGQRWQPQVGSPKYSLVARLFPLAAVDGMVNPLALEVLVNPRMLPIERPFLLAHEWAHLAGYARESEASFVAWLACLEGNRRAQYSAWLAVYPLVVHTLPGGAASLTERLDAGPLADFDAIRARTIVARPWLRQATWRTYDRYLRANRVDSGVANYDEVVTLLLGSPLAADPLLP